MLGSKKSVVHSTMRQKHYEHHRYVYSRDLIGVATAALSTIRQAFPAVRMPADCNGRCLFTYAFNFYCLKLST
jgi:hypothetical protein